MQEINILWFKKDLRIEDNEALIESLKDSDIIPIYIIEKELWMQKTHSDRQWQFCKECLIDLTNNRIKPATQNYTDFLDEVSKKQSAIEIMFAMTPCMRLYSWIGKSLSKKILNNPYKEWIITYSDQSFDNLAKSLENLIDSSKEVYDINQANFLYKRAMELELDFFNAYSNY